MLDVVIFSKDRACQLDLLLRSIKHEFADWREANIQVLYTYSNRRFGAAYDGVLAAHPEFSYICELDREESFRELTLELVGNNPYVTFLVDDDVFKQPFTLDAPEFLRFAEDPSIMCLSLRMCPRMDYCYTRDFHTPTPSFEPGNVWEWRGLKGDWGYPMSIDGHIFRSAELAPLVHQLDFRNPNTFEDILSRNPLPNPKAICFDESRVINLPVNRVQDTAPNRHGVITADWLNDRYLSGSNLSLATVTGVENPSPHHELPLQWDEPAADAPLVSVVIPCFNAEAFLAETLDSVATQTFGDLEAIVVDDGSADASVAVAERYRAEHPELSLRVMRRPPAGHPARTRNSGVANARGRYVLCLDADDLLTANFVERCVETLEQHPEAGVAYADQQDFGGSDRYHTVPEYDFVALTRQNCLGIASLFRRQAWVDAGGFDGSGRYEDWDFWIGCGEHGHHGIRVDGTHWRYRVRPDGRFLTGGVTRDRFTKAQIVLRRPGLYTDGQRRWAQAVLAGDPVAEAIGDELYVIPELSFEDLARAASPAPPALVIQHAAPEPTATLAPEPTATLAPEPTATLAPEPTATLAPEPGPAPAPVPQPTALPMPDRLQAQAVATAAAATAAAAAALAATVPAPVPVPAATGARTVAGPAGTFVTVVLAEEAIRHPELITGYSRRFSSGDDAKLVLFAPDANPAELSSRLAPLVETARLDAPQAPAVTALAVPAAEGEAVLLGHAHAVLTADGETGALGRLPSFGGDAIDQLRAHADRIWTEPATPDVIFPTPGGFEVPADRADLYGTGDHADRNVVEHFRAAIADDSAVVYDIGAGGGYFSVLAGSLGATVYSFEPVSARFDVLRRNRARNGLPHGGAFCLALGATAGHRTSGRDTIATATLDDCAELFALAPPTVVKLDVDGDELAVVQGAHRLLDHHHPTLIVTGGGGDARAGLVDQLLTLGYDVWGLSDDVEDWTPYQVELFPLVPPAALIATFEPHPHAADLVPVATNTSAPERAPSVAPTAAAPPVQPSPARPELVPVPAIVGHRPPGWDWFSRDLATYRAMQGGGDVSDADLMPKLTDKTPGNPYDGHYFFQDVWAARRVAELRPAEHVDVGSRIDYVGFLTALTNVVFVDIRLLDAQIDGLRAVTGSILEMPFPDRSLESVSCLHVAEHIGLGRYGDPLNPNGTVEAARELQRVIRPGGQLLFAVPVGRPRTCFNAHRIFDPRRVPEMFGELALVEFSGVDDTITFRRHRALEELAGCNYACGMYLFRRPLV